jgi:hypothetical protein
MLPLQAWVSRRMQWQQLCLKRQSPSLCYARWPPSTLIKQSRRLKTAHFPCVSDLNPWSTNHKYQEWLTVPLLRGVGSFHPCKTITKKAPFPCVSDLNPWSTNRMYQERSLCHERLPPSTLIDNHQGKADKFPYMLAAIYPDSTIAKVDLGSFVAIPLIQ